MQVVVSVHLATAYGAIINGNNCGSVNLFYKKFGLERGTLTLKKEVDAAAGVCMRKTRRSEMSVKLMSPTSSQRMAEGGGPAGHTQMLR